MTSVRRGLAGAALVAMLGVSAGAPEGPCVGPQSDFGPSQDLYCLELIATPGNGGVTGTVELGRTPGPFTVGVTADGIARYAPTISLAGLPAPASLGGYTTYVAWAATPLMYPVVRLGEVGNGRTRLAVIELDKFVILVTAERSARPAEPSRRLILRGTSPSMRLQPPDLSQFVLGATPADASPMHHQADGAFVSHPDTLSWASVPMPPGLPMLPGEMALRPLEPPYLPRAGAGTPWARRRELVRLRDGDTLRLVSGLVRRTIKGRAITMYGFNGQFSGPLVEVTRGAAITVQFRNDLDQPTTVHWHGIRLDNRFDGVPGLTQKAVPPGGRFTYRIRFPDAGLYWYHPHVREEAQQDLGLYGNIVVRSPRPDYFSPAHREEVLILDDLLLGADGLVPYGRTASTHALTGRFGNQFLVNGEPDYHLNVRRGEVVRFLLTNVSNTRTLNLSFPGSRMKVVGGDAGNFEREEWVESVVIAPAERYIVHVRFDHPGMTPFVNRVQALDHLYGRFFPQWDTLGTVTVAGPAGAPAISRTFDVARPDTAAAADIARFRKEFARPVDRTLVLAMASQDLPFITRQLMQLDSIWFAPVEWSGTMPTMNWSATTRQVRWVLRDAATGRENMDIDWRFRRGDVVKLRLVNERRTLHAMQHPIHVHGQRFLVLDVNGVPSDNLVWKDTVLVPAGSVVDLLVDLSNPGRWMLHCHIAEHLAADMMMAFTVD